MHTFVAVMLLCLAVSVAEDLICWRDLSRRPSDAYRDDHPSDAEDSDIDVANVVENSDPEKPTDGELRKFEIIDC